MSKTAKRPPSMRPHEAVVLGVDPGKRAGWALFVRGRLLKSGSVASFSLRRVTRIVETAVNVAREEVLPLIVVAEDWTAGGWKSLELYGRLCETWGAWRIVVTDHGTPIVRVYMQTWRSALGIKANLPTAVAKERAGVLAAQLFGVAAADSDQAEAIAIGWYGSHCAEVGVLLEDRAS